MVGSSQKGMLQLAVYMSIFALVVGKWVDYLLRELP